MAAIAVVLVVLGSVLLGWQATGALAERYRDAERTDGHKLILLSLLSGVVGGMLPLAAILAIARIAFALAVQPTLQTLLSDFTLFADRPIPVGDFCRFGDKMGLVEHVGIRSTRLRTVDRTVISVPHRQFLETEPENFSHRD